MLKQVLTLFFGFAFLVGNGQSFEAELARAKQEQKQVLLVFSGSDWCRPCIEFERNVLSKDAFINYLDTALVFYKADFPRKKELVTNLWEENEKLADAYNPNGHFPYIVLFNAKGEKLKTKKGGFKTFTELYTWVEE